MKKQIVGLFSAILLVAGVQQAGASVFISNLDPADYSVATQEIGQEIGQSIVTGSTALSLTSVLFPETAGTAPGQYFGVFGRNSDGTVGNVLFTGFTLDFDSTSDIATATVDGSFTLQPDTGYYLVLVSSQTLEGVDWNYTKDTDYASEFGVTLPATDTSFVNAGTRNFYSNLSDGPQVLEVNGIPVAVPEPSTAAFLGLALAGGLVVLARRRAVRA